MDKKSLISSFLMILMMFSCVSSDFAEDKKECQDQLLGLSPCLTFVSGNAKAPSLSCCSEISKDANKYKLCLCILVKDRNEPGLGFRLNATLALSLPLICHSQSHASECPELLHLAPNSTEAQVFEQFNTTTGIANIIPSSSNKFKVKGIQQAAIEGFLIWILLSLCSSKIEENYLH